MRYLLMLCALLLLALPAWAIPDTTSEMFTFQSAAGSAIGGNVMNVEPYGTISVEVVISASATVTFEAASTSTFYAMPCVNKSTGVTSMTTTTTGLFQCEVAGLSTFRTRISTFGSGTITSIGRAATSTAVGLFNQTDWLSSGDKLADALVKTGAGVVHTLTCASDAAATAGQLAVRDGTSAGGGTLIQQLEFVAAYYPASTQILDQPFVTGLFLDYTTTGDVHCSVSYR